MLEKLNHQFYRDLIKDGVWLFPIGRGSNWGGQPQRGTTISVEISQNPPTGT